MFDSECLVHEGVSSSFRSEKTEMKNTQTRELSSPQFKHLCAPALGVVDVLNVRLALNVSATQIEPADVTHTQQCIQCEDCDFA